MEKSGRKQAEGDFLKTTLLSKSKESIFFYSNLPISELGLDDDFKKKWMLVMAMLLKKGLHLNMVHNVDRPINEMILGIESWIPIYMTGSISPYYFKEPPSKLFSESTCVSGVVALSSECIGTNEDKSRFYLTTKKEELNYYKSKAKYLLSKTYPLMEIYKEGDKEKFKEFMKGQDKSKIQKIQNNTFKKIDFDICKNNWIIINKKTSPEIHFVIYNPKLRDAIETFLKS